MHLPAVYLHDLQQSGKTHGKHVPKLIELVASHVQCNKFWKIREQLNIEHYWLFILLCCLWDFVELSWVILVDQPKRERLSSKSKKSSARPKSSEGGSEQNSEDKTWALAGCSNVFKKAYLERSYN